MNPIHVPMFVSVFLTLLAACALLSAWITSRPRGRQFTPLANDGALTWGIHHGARKTYLADAAIATRYMLVKAGSDDNHMAIVSSVLDIPLGICTDEPADTVSPVNVQLLNGADRTVPMTAAGAITAGQPVVTNGDGYVKALPSTAGMYWCVGFAVTTATTLGDLVEVQPALFPIGVNVLT